VSILAMHVNVLVKGLAKDISKAKLAYAYANAAEKTSEVFREDKVLYYQVQIVLHCGIYPLLRPHRESMDPIINSHRPLLNAGNIDYAIGGGICYAQAWLCAGLPLNSPLLKPKLLLYEEAAIRLQRPTFQLSFSSVRQLVLNLQKSPANPTELKGDAFDEESVLGTLEGNSLRTSRRDTSTLRLFLALIFWDEECMINMLEILSDFAEPDVSTSRTHFRLFVIGLAGFEMGRKKKDKSLIELANECLKYFRKLTKLGSSSATPIYRLIKAVSSPSKSSYDEAISMCHEGRLMHFEAMAYERCGMFLQQEKHTDVSNEYIATSYWLYTDWGATSKANSMMKTYSFLKGMRRPNQRTRSDASSVMRLANSTGNK